MLTATAQSDLSNFTRTTEVSVALRMKSKCLNILFQSLKHEFWPLLTCPASIPVHATRRRLVGPVLSPFMSPGSFLPPGLCRYPSICLEFFSLPTSSTQLLSSSSVPPSGKPPFQVNSCWRPASMPSSQLHDDTVTSQLVVCLVIDSWPPFCSAP